MVYFLFLTKLESERGVILPKLAFTKNSEKLTAKIPIMREELQEIKRILLSKQVFALLIGLLLLVFSISLFFFFSNEKAKLVEETYVELETINKYKAHLIDLWIEERESDVKFISDIHLMHKEFTSLMKDPTNINLKKDISNHYSFLKDAYKYEDVAIYDRNGNYLLSVNDKKSKHNQETIDLIKSNLKSVKHTHCYLTDDSSSNFDIVFPLNYSENEVNLEAIVYVVMKLNPSKHIGSILQSWPIETKTAETILYENNNDFIYNVVPVSNLISKSKQLVLNMSQNNVMIVQAINGKSQRHEALDYKNNEVYGYISKIGKLNWYLVTKINKEEVFREFNIRMYITLGVILVLFLSAVLILIYLRKDELNNVYVDLYKNELILRLKNEIFKTTLYSIGDGVITTDANGNITQMNPVAEEMTGWTESEAIGQRLENVYTIYNEVTGDELISPVNKVLHTGQIFHLSNSTIVVSKNGNKTPIANNAAPIRDELGKLTGVVLVIRDHTEEKKARKKLIEKEQYANEILYKLNEAQKLAKIGSWEIDLVTNETWWSDEIYSIYEEDKDTFKPTVNSNEKYVTESKLTEKREIVNIAIANHKEFDFDDSITTAKGNIKQCRVIGKAVYNSKGEPIKLVASVMDITEAYETQKALIDNISNYKNLVESSQEAILVYRDMKIIFANDSCLNLLGISYKNEIIGKEFSAIIHKDSHSLILNRINEIESKEGIKLVTVKLIKKDGTFIYAEVSTSKYNDTEGLAYQLVIRDITQKLASEKQLRKLETAVKQSPASIVITDLLGRIEYVNPKFEEITGYTSEEAINNNPRILKSGYKTKEEYIELWDTISSGKTWSGEFLNIKKNKEEYWESATIAPIFDENGTIINYIGIKLDITDKKIAEQLLADNEHKFRSYIEKAPIGIFITDSNGIVSEINKACAKIAGLEPSDILGTSFDKFLDDDYKTDVLNKYLHLQVGDSYSIELPVYDINKNKVWVVIHTTHLSENVYLSYALDINDIKQYQEELIAAKNEAEEMNKLKTSFLANMSHELRTPMIGILGFAQLLEKEDDLNEIKEMSHLVYESGRRLMDTLNSILNLSKIESGSVKIQEDTFDLIPFLFEVTQIYKSLAKQNNIDLIISNKDSELNLVSDKRMLTDIINNLINNAVKFTEAGTITLTEEVIKIDNEPYVKIDVIDTGIGISKENVEFIFEEFRQGSEGIARKYEGSGLGLTVSRKYALLLDGDLSVVSEKGKGSTFTLIFPLRKIETENSASSVQQDLQSMNESNNSGLKKLLYVEDDEISIQYLNRICPKNFEVFSTRNKIDALKILESNKIDIVLMDINLGNDENGIDITNTIKQIPKFESIPVVACTAYAMHGDREDFMNKGCDDYISKPFEKSSLIDLLNKWTS